jgi:hypothetical protein
MLVNFWKIIFNCKCRRLQITAFRPEPLTWQHNNKVLRSVSSLLHEVYQKCTILGHYASCSSNYSPTFRDNVLVPPSMVKNLDHWMWDRKFFPKSLYVITATRSVIVHITQFCTISTVCYSQERSWPSQRGKSPLTIATKVGGKHTDPAKSTSP